MPRPRSTPRKLTAVAALVLASAGVVVGQKAYEYAADPSGEKDCSSLGVTAVPDAPAATATPASPAPGLIADAASLPWSQRGGTLNDASCLNRTAVYGVVQVTTVEQIQAALELRPRQQPQGLPRRRPAQHGRPRLRPERPRARHDPLQRHVAQPGHQRPDRPERRHLARHPELPAPAVRRQGDAVHRHLHRRRLDRRQRPRHGSPGRLGRQHHPIDARHAAGRHHPARQPDREPGAVQPRGRRLRPVRHRPGRRPRRDRQRHLHHRPPGDRLPGVPRPVRHRARHRTARSASSTATSRPRRTRCSGR